MNCDYDEEQELCRYVVCNYWHVLTEREIEIEQAVMLELDALDATSNDKRNFGRVPHRLLVEDVAALCEKARNQFARRCYERLWRQYSREIYVNRCERCARIATSPIACVCLWCGHGWFERRAEMIKRAKSAIYPNSKTPAT